MDNEIDVITNQGDLIDYIFLSLYTIEMILKIVAMGFFMRPFSYLRDPWNVLDFTVIFLGWISNLFSGSNISSFRVIRILRPLKTINSMPGMSTLITTILNSLPFMIDILVLFCFMILMSNSRIFMILLFRSWNFMIFMIFVILKWNSKIFIIFMIVMWNYRFFIIIRIL